MNSMFSGTAYVHGRASGKLLYSHVELSVWGGVDAQSGKIIDQHHPLCGQYLRDNLLAIPGGRGSCSGSGVILELLLNGQGPKAIIFERREEILTLGVMIVEEIFSKSIPVIVIGSAAFRMLSALHGEIVFVDGGRVSRTELDTLSPPISAVSSVASMFHGIVLNEIDRAYLDGHYGEASQVAIRIVLRMASLMGANELMNVSQVHIDGCHYTGPGSLAFAKKLRDLGGRVQVPTTLNSISIDKRKWRALGVDVEFGEASTALADAYVEMGARPTFTCAPYQLDTAPVKGEQVAWAESNAVVYANSVLGARTMKYPDFLDIAIALTGRAPNAGVHLAFNRLATLHIHVPTILEDIDDSFYPLLGYVIGSLAVSCIPVITGLEARKPSRNDLKAFGAAFATTSSAAMFHIIGVTPEAPTLAAASCKSDDFRTIELNWSLLNACWERFNQLENEKCQKVDLVSLGNPHFSFAELRRLSNLCNGRTKHQDAAVIVTCSRTILGLASQAGLIEALEQFGVQFITDTCWCMIAEPVIPRRAQVIMTNSGKYAHYGPGLTNRKFCFGGLEACVEVACQGIWNAQKPQWLTRQVRVAEDERLA